MTTLLLLLALPAAALEAPKTAEVFLTAQGGPRLASTGTVAFSPAAQPLESQPFVYVDPAKKFQTLIGIGGALTDAAADAFATLPPAQQAAVARAFYDPREGLGYTLARTNIHSCDFSSMSYTYAAEGDAALKTFDIAHDRDHRIPLLKAAMAAAGGALPSSPAPGARRPG